MKEQDLKDFQLQIARLAKTEEEVRNILWELTRTDWESVWGSDKVQCQTCYRLIQRREVAASSRCCCETCVSTGLTLNCRRCGMQFHTSAINPEKECQLCLSQICQVCQLPTLPPLSLYQRGQSFYQPLQNCQFRVICYSCLGIQVLPPDWEYRELRKISTHISHSGGHLSLREWVSTIQDFNWKCAYCMSAHYEHMDHFIPISKGGCTTKDNCVPACKECNKRKGRRMPEHVIDIPQDALTRVHTYLQRFSSVSEISLKSS